jgi:hypothetical protein
MAAVQSPLTSSDKPFMDTRSHDRSNSGEALKRVLIVAVGVALFFGVSSIIKPPPQSASATPLTPRSQPTVKPRKDLPYTFAQASRGDHPKGWRLVGQLEGREHNVLCFASPQGPRFSVFSRDGKLLQADLPADEVYRAFPALDIENMQMPKSETGPLMLMDQDR